MAENMDRIKSTANDLVGFVKNYEQGLCTRDRLLENIGLAIQKESIFQVNNLEITKEIRLGHFSNISKEILYGKCEDGKYNLSENLIKYITQIADKKYEKM